MFTIELDIDGYWTGVWSTIGNINNGVEVNTLQAVSEDKRKQRCYKYNKDTHELVLDEDKYNSILTSNYVVTSLPVTEMMLESKKVQMISQSNTNLENFLKDVKMPSSVHGGIEKYYTVTRDKQNDLNSMISYYQTAQSIGVETTLNWNATGETCEEWTIEELSILALQIKDFVFPYTERQRQMEIQIKNAKSLEELNNIDISF